MALYMAPVATMQQAMASTDPAQMKSEMDEWNKWGKKHEKAIVDMGTPLGKSKKVGMNGVSDTKNDIGGYAIVQGDSLDSVSQIFVGHPHLKMLKGAWIEIVECMPI